MAAYQHLPASVTADLVARAIVAAARSYGDDPVVAITTTCSARRRSLTAAASGVAYAVEVTSRRLAGVLQLNVDTVKLRRRAKDPAFVAAEDAARRAALVELERGQVASPPKAVEPSPVVSPDMARRAVLADAERVRAAERLAAARRPTPKVVAPRPGAVTPSPPVAADPDGALVQRVVAALENKGSASPMTLAYLVTAKELDVSRALAQLESEKRAVAGAMPVAGRRAQLWSLAEAGR